MSDQIVSNFIICPASAVPPAGGSKFDKTALIDAFLNVQQVLRQQGI